MSSKLKALIEKVAELEPVVSRKVAAMVGASIADACSVRLEWIYSQQRMDKIIGDKDPTFWPDCHSPYYILDNGKISGYGDEAVQTLRAMAQNQGAFDAHKLLEHYCQYFGDPSSPYQVSLKIRGDWKKDTSALPVEGPWIQKAVIKMMENYRQGVWPTGTEDGYEHDGLVAFLPLIIQQSPKLNHEELKDAIKLCTKFPYAVGHHLVEAELLSKFIEGSEHPVEDVRNIFSGTKGEIDAVTKGLAEHIDHRYLVRKCGMACELPGSFMSSLVIILRANSYAEGVRENIRAAGALCARANLVGACLGAKFGIKAIPFEWLDRVECSEQIIEDSIKCFNR